MSDIQFEDEEELAALKSLGKKARSDSQEARLLLLRVDSDNPEIKKLLQENE